MIVPEYLKPGDNVGIVATAKKVSKGNTVKGIDVLKSWGLNVIPGKSLYDEFHQFAGSDEQRLADFQKMIDDPGIKAIFIARGGYGTTRIFDAIDFTHFEEHPKWICGFSDITALQLHLFNLGISSLHGPMPSFFHSVDQNSLDYLKGYLFGCKEKYEIETHPLNRPGKVSGKLIGGNLSIICHTIGTSSEIDTNGNILFIEDVGEKLYHLDRMMVQLKRAGFLDHLAGLIVGQFSEMEDDKEEFGLDAYEIVYSHIKAYTYPVAFNFPLGHTKLNYPVHVGVDGLLSVSERLVELS